MDDHGPRTNTNWIDSPTSRGRSATIERKPMSRSARELESALGRLGEAIVEADRGAPRRASEFIAQHPARVVLAIMAMQIGDARMLALLEKIWTEASEDRGDLILRLFPPKEPGTGPRPTSLEQLARRQLIGRVLADGRITALYQACQTVNSQLEGERA